MEIIGSFELLTIERNRANIKTKSMNEDKNTPGRYVLFPSVKKWEMAKEAGFYDQKAFAASQLERALDLRNCGLPVVGLGIHERIKYHFFHNFRPFWVR